MATLDIDFLATAENVLDVGESGLKCIQEDKIIHVVRNKNRVAYINLSAQQIRYYEPSQKWRAEILSRAYSSVTEASWLVTQ